MSRTAEQALADLTASARRKADLATATVASLRAEIAERVTGGHRVESVASSLNQLAKAEAQRDVYCVAHTMLAQRANIGAVLSVITSHVLIPGSDDTSGRTGDVRRAGHDGAQEAAREVLQEIAFLLNLMLPTDDAAAPAVA